MEPVWPHQLWCTNFKYDKKEYEYVTLFPIELLKHSNKSASQWGGEIFFGACQSDFWLTYGAHICQWLEVILMYVEEFGPLNGRPYETTISWGTWSIFCPITYTKSVPKCRLFWFSRFIAFFHLDIYIMLRFIAKAMNLEKLK